MIAIENWPLYMAPPGSEYRLIFEPELPGIEPDMSIMRQYMDSRQSVDVRKIERVPAGVAIEVAVFRDGTLHGSVGRFVYDGRQFWQIKTVTRIDNGAPGIVGVTLGRLYDAVLDKPEREWEEIKRAAGDTASTVASGAVTIGKFTVPLLMVAGGLFFLLKGGSFR